MCTINGPIIVDVVVMNGDENEIEHVPAFVCIVTSYMHIISACRRVYEWVSIIHGPTIFDVVVMNGHEIENLFCFFAT